MYFLYKRNTSECILKIKSEKDYFSNIANNANTITAFIRFLSENEFLYSEFREDAQLLITNKIKTDFSAKVVAWFLDKNFESHLENIKNIIDNWPTTFKNGATKAAYQRLVDVGISKGCRNKIIEFIIWRFKFAKTYNEADNIFSNILNPNKHLLQEKNIHELCEVLNDNQQTYGRNQAAEDHDELKNYIINNINNKFDFTIYPNVF